MTGNPEVIGTNPTGEVITSGLPVIRPQSSKRATGVPTSYNQPVSYCCSPIVVPEIFKDWLTNRYHAPSDDVNQPVDLQSAALYEEFTRRLLLGMANSPARPQWKAESFFRRYAGD